MTRRGTPLRSASIALAALVATGSCSSRERDTSTTNAATATQPAETAPNGATNPAVTLPDLSAVAASVRSQLETRYAALQATLASTPSPASEVARRYGDLGHLLAAATFFDEAILCYRHAEAREPAEARWPYARAHAHVKAGDRAAAAAAFERTLALRPQYTPALVWLADMYLDTGRPELAQTTYARALDLDPGSAAAHFGAGRAALARGAHAEAVAHLEAALQADPQASAVHYPLAMAYRAAGDRVRAAAGLQRRGSRAPSLPDPLLDEATLSLDSPVALEGEGMRALRAQDWATAVAAFRKGLTLAPGDPSLRYWLGSALAASGDTAGAAREFTTIVQEHPGYARAHFSLGALAAMRGQHAQALRAFEAAVRHDPTLPEAHLRLADTLRATGRAGDAAAHYDTAVRLDPGLVDAWIGGAQALVAAGRTADAQAWLARARQVHPNHPQLDTLAQRLR